MLEPFYVMQNKYWKEYKYMNKDYPFTGSVTLSAQEYADLILDLNKAQKDAQMYLDAFKSVQKRYEELVKSAEDNF